MRRIKSVLVVDDDDAIRDMVAETLQYEGYAVEVAENGAEALERLRQKQPDAIVLDLMMPVMDGWQFVEALRELDARAEVPIVVMSAAHQLHETADRLLAKGVRAVLAKPFDLDALIGVIERYVPPIAI